MKTIKRIIWTALLIAIIGTMLTTCHSCGKKEDKKPTANATEAQKKELHQLETIAAMQKKISDLEAQRGTAPVQPTVVQPTIFQPTSPTAPVSIIPINRYVPAPKSSPQINNLRAQIWKLEADMSVAKTQRLMGQRGGEASDIALANIRAMQMTLTDMKAELARLQSQ